MKKLNSNIFMAAALLGSTMQASAAVINLTNDNTDIAFNDADASIQNWVIDGSNIVYEQYLYYRVNNAGGENRLDALTLTNSASYANRFLELQYAATGFILDLTYVVDGGAAGSRVSDVAQTLTVTNTGANALDISLFLYNDFDLGSTASDDSAVQVNANTIRQSDADIGYVETVGTPAPTHFEIDSFSNIRDQLDDLSPTVLLDVDSFSGDVTWAWQWDLSLQAGASSQISLDTRADLNPVPLPSALWLFGSGLIGLATMLRRRAG